jgi:8-oxo-dGTP diphosphatase
VHRPKHDDWSLPKGKLDPGESHQEAALREVEEETGVSCRLRRSLGAVSYRDSRGRRKEVRYWLMEPVAGSFAPSREVDAIRWLRPEEALAALTYDLDRDVLRLAAGVPLDDAR